MKTKTEGKHKEPCPQCGSVAPETRGALTTPLIAAAPELLEAAKLAVSFLDQIRNGVVGKEIDFYYSRLTAAIAKAEEGK